MIDNLISIFIIWWCKRKLNELRVDKYPGINFPTIYEIKGTGKDYPNYLMFTDVERVRDKMLEI